MKNSLHFLLILFVLLVSGCSIPHHVQKDYAQYLKNNTGTSNLPQTDKAALYFLPEETQNFSYEFRSFITGAANLWIVEFGKMLEDTLMSEDVQKAFQGIEKNAEQTLSSELLVFDLMEYKFEEFGAHIALNISLVSSGQTLLTKSYSASGKTQGGKMFWGGVFAQKNAVQQSTKLAMDEILRELINDINKLNENDS